MDSPLPSSESCIIIDKCLIIPQLRQLIYFFILNFWRSTFASIVKYHKMISKNTQINILFFMNIFNKYTVHKTYFSKDIIFGIRTWRWTWVWSSTEVGLGPHARQRVWVTVSSGSSQNILFLFGGILPWCWWTRFPWRRWWFRFLPTKFGFIFSIHTSQKGNKLQPYLWYLPIIIQCM